MSKKDIVKRRKNEVIKEAVIEKDQTKTEKPKQNLSFLIVLIILCLFIGILLVLS